jgi:WD40 repeat protein
MPARTGPRQAMSPATAARLSRLLVACHPRRWRQRYADELLDVLDQYQPTARTVLNLWVSAVSAQFDPAWWGRPSAPAVRNWMSRPVGSFVTVSLILLLLLGGILGGAAYEDHLGNIGPPMPLSDGTFGMAVSPDGRLVAAINPNLEIWSAADPARPVRLGYSVGDLVGAPGAFAPNGWLLVTSGGPGILWDVSHSTPRPREIATLPSDHSSGGVNQYLFFPDGRTLASANVNGTLSLWDTADPRHPARIATLAVVANAASPTNGGQLTGLTALAVAASPAAGGLMLASGDQGGVVTLWQAGNPARMARLATLPRQGSGAAVSAVAFSPDGHVLASASDDGTVVLRDVTRPADPVVLAVLHLAIPGTRAELSQLDSNVEIAFSADGRALTAIAGNTAVTRWDVASLPAVTRVFTVTSRDAIGSGAVAFAPGGNEVAGPPAAGDTLALWRFPSENKPPPVRASRS